jgi:nitrous oxidase accessory protein NosD
LGQGADVAAAGLLVQGTLEQQGDQTRGRGILVKDGARLSLEAAALRENQHVGLFALGAGADVSAAELLIEGTLPQESDQTGGLGIAAQDGAQLSLLAVGLWENRDVGLFVSGAGTNVSAAGLLIAGTLSRESDQARGLGIEILNSAHVSIEATTVRENRGVGLFASDAGTDVSAVGLLVEGTLAHEIDETWGRGIHVREGARLSVGAAALRNNRDVGLLASGAGTDVNATGLLVEETLPQESDQTSGRGIGVQLGAHLSLEAAALRKNRDAGLFVSSADTDVSATGLLVEGTLPEGSNQTRGHGIAVQEGARASLKAAVVRENRDVGLFVTDVGTDVSAVGILVEGTLPQESDRTHGWGIGVQDGAHLCLQGAALRENRSSGLHVWGTGTDVSAAGLLVEGTQPRDIDQTGGRGIDMHGGARLVVEAAALRKNRTTGLFASAPGTDVSAVGLLVEGTLPQESDKGFGRGISVQAGAFSRRTRGRR